jgi:hypothetical protein
MRCTGSFTDESQQKLRAEYAADSTALLFGKCECGQRIFARSKHGTWVPDPHNKPTKYRSGKSGYKR